MIVFVDSPGYDLAIQLTELLLGHPGFWEVFSRGF